MAASRGICHRCGSEKRRKIERGIAPVCEVGALGTGGDGLPVNEQSVPVVAGNVYDEFFRTCWEFDHSPEVPDTIGIARIGGIRYPLSARRAGENDGRSVLGEERREAKAGGEQPGKPTKHSGTETKAAQVLFGPTSESSLSQGQITQKSIARWGPLTKRSRR